MLVKTFEGINIADVVKNVKKEFGKDAVILETKEKKMEDGLGTYVEVKAAVSDAPKINGANVAPLDSQYIPGGLQEKMQKIDLNLQHITDSMALKDQLVQIEYSLKDLKLLISDQSKHSVGQECKDLPEYLTSIYQQLMLTGVSRPNLLELTEHLKAVPSFSKGAVNGLDSSVDYYRGQAISYMLKKINISKSISMLKGHTLIQAFVGPSGGGKTSNIVKLASYYMKKDRAKVLLVSFGEKRLAGSESMRIYSKVLNVPYVSVATVEELEEELLQRRDTDLVLIDTYGRYPKNDQDLSDLLELKESSLPIDLHLVLSLTEKDLQLERAVSSFSSLGIQSLLFTKLDESWTYGDIYNLSHKWKLPLSFFSTGSSIPADIEKSCKERVIERLFGL